MKRLSRRKTLLLLLFIIILTLGFSLGINAATETSDDTVDFVILIDTTKSMDNADKNNICEAAAKMFADLAPSNNARVAIVAYGNHWPLDKNPNDVSSVNYTFRSSALSYLNDIGNYARKRIDERVSLTIIDSIDIRTDIKDAIHEVYAEKRNSQTNTYIGGGLMTALDVLEKNASKDAALILMSDGRLSGLETVAAWNKISNAELVDRAVDFAAERDWKIYTIELNDDGLNDSAYSLAHTRMVNIAKETGATTKQLKNVDIGSLVDSFVGIFGDFMGTETSLQEKTIQNGECRFSLPVPEITSETNIVITGGSINSVSVDGKQFTSNTYTDSAYFVKNQDGHYSLLKLFAPKAGNLDVVVKGTNGAKINIQVVNTQDLPIGLASAPGDERFIRGTTVDFHAFLANPENGVPVDAPNFYGKSPAKLTIHNNSTGKTQTYAMSPNSDGCTASHTFDEPGVYDVTVAFTSSQLRDGGKSFSRTIIVDNYSFETQIAHHADGSAIAEGEILTVKAIFTDTKGEPLERENIYHDGEATLIVTRAGKKVAELAMSGSEDGYTTEYTPDAKGEYIFEVTTTAALLAGTPASMKDATNPMNCTGSRFEATLTPIGKDGKMLEYTEGGEYEKGSYLAFNAGLVNENGEKVVNSKWYTEDAVTLTIKRDGKTLETLTVPYDAEADIYAIKWRAAYSGALEIDISLSGVSGATTAYRVTIVGNVAPGLTATPENTELYVGQTLTLPISRYFDDANDDPLNIAVEFNKKNADGEPEWELSEDGANILIHAGGYGCTTSVTVTADDNDVTTETSFQLTIINRKIEKTGSIDIPHFVLNPPPFMFFIQYDSEPHTYRLSDYFADPDGLPLTYSLTPDSDKVYIDDELVLHVAPDAPMSEKFTLVIADSGEHSEKLTLSVQADDWWTLNITRFLIIVGVALFVIILGIVIFKKESQIGKIRITSIIVGNSMLSIDELLNDRRIRKSSLRLRDICVTRLSDMNERSMLNQALLGSDVVIVGHMIFGSTIKLKRLRGASVMVNGVPARGSRIKLKSGDSVAITINGTEIVLLNNN